MRIIIGARSLASRASRRHDDRSQSPADSRRASSLLLFPYVIAIDPEPPATGRSTHGHGRSFAASRCVTPPAVATIGLASRLAPGVCGQLSVDRCKEGRMHPSGYQPPPLNRTYLTTSRRAPRVSGPLVITAECLLPAVSPPGDVVVDEGSSRNRQVSRFRPESEVPRLRHTPRRWGVGTAVG